AARRRKVIYSLLVFLAVGMAMVRIAAVAPLRSLFEGVSSTLPIFNANDRARWATIRALVNERTYAIGARDRHLLEPSAVSLLAAQHPLEAATLANAGYTFRVASVHGIITEENWSS